MNPATAPHPTPAVLAAYGLGKLSPAQTEVIAGHLEHCEACRKVVEGVPADSLLALLKAGRPAARTGTVPGPGARPQAPPKAASFQNTHSGSSNASVANVTASWAGRPVAGTDLPPGLANHPRYRIVRLLGKGGMGAVFLAEHSVMGQMRAIKVVKPALVDSPQALERFHREVKTAAMLDHPNIVRAFDAEQSESSHFLVMEFVEGVDLAAVLERKGSLPVAHSCHYVRQAALGLQYAHERNMVHRDLKPENLLLTSKGVVKILDFGLAKVRSDAVDLSGQTAENVLMGTPNFMAPEQWQDARSAGIQADIYSLGCTLYALLTGSPPFEAAPGLPQKMLAHLQEKPKPVHAVRAEVPVELSALVDRMLAKNAADRPQTPLEVAQALQPFTKAPAKATLAAPPPGQAAAGPNSTPWEGLAEAPEKVLLQAARKKEKPRSNRWMAPPGIAVALLAAGLVAASIAGIVLFWQSPNGTVRIESDDPNVEIVFDKSGPTIKVADKPIKLGAGAHGVLVKRGDFEFETDKFMLKKGDTITLNVELLQGKIQVKADGQVIGTKELPAVAAVGASSGGVPTSADALRREKIAPGELAAAGGGDPNRAPPELVAILGDSRLNHWAIFAPTWIGASALNYSGDGKTLATASVDGTARLWETVTGNLLRSFEGHEGPVCALALSPDGMTLATGSDDRTVKLWEAGSGRLRMPLEKQPGGISCLTFSPDGQMLAGAIRDGKAGVYIWEAATGRPRRVILVPKNLWSVVFSPDGKTVAAGGGRWWGPAEGKGWVRLFDLDTGNERHVLMGHREPVTSVAFSPDGKTLASTSWDATARLWDSATGKEIRELTGHGNRVLSASFSPDGKMLATSSDQFNIRFWEVATGKLQALLDRESQQAVAFSPDGKTLVSAGYDHTVRLWDVATRRELPVSSAHTHSVNHLAISPDGKTLACGGNDPSVSLWDVATGRKRRELEGHDRRVTTATAFSPVGSVLASGGLDATVRLWDATTGKALKTLTGHKEEVTALAFSRDGQTLASGSTDKTVRLWDISRGGEAWLRLEGHSLPVRTVAFSPDGKTLASSGDDKSVKLWDAATGQLRTTLEGHEANVRSVGFTPDGQTLISAGADKTVRLWDLSKKQVRLNLEGHTAAITSLAVSPDGQMLASTGGDGTVRLRDTATGRVRQLLQLGPIGGWVNGVVFTPDGRHLATANGNGTVYILRLPAKVSR